MSNEIRVIHMGRAAGKTTKALQLLAKHGGGIFVTTHPMQAMAVAQKMKLEGISIIPCGPGTNIAIDDIDWSTGEIVVTSNKPVKLDVVEKPNTTPTPYIKF